MTREITDDTFGQGQPSAQDTGSRQGQDELALRLSELARTLEQQVDPHETLRSVVAAAVELIPGTDEGSVSVVAGRRHVHSEAASSELPEKVDALQVEVGQGPCLDALYEQQTVRVPDLCQDQRWPKFSRRAAELGAGSMLTFQLYVEGDNLGALNLYAAQPGAFDDESEHVGLMFAAHASVAYAAARQQSQMQASVETRDLIGTAKGILMERFSLTPDRAFALLVRASQDGNTKLRDVAERLVGGGPLDP